MQTTIEQLDSVLSNEVSLKETENTELLLLKKPDSNNSKKPIKELQQSSLTNSNSKFSTFEKKDHELQTNVGAATILRPFATLQRNSSVSSSSIKNNASSNLLTDTSKYGTKSTTGLLKSFSKLHSPSTSTSSSNNYSTPMENVGDLSDNAASTSDLNFRIVRAQSLRDITSKFEQKPSSIVLTANNLEPISSLLSFSKKLNEMAPITGKETNAKRFSLLEVSSLSTPKINSDDIDLINYTKLHHHQPNSSSATPAISKEYIIELHRKLAGKLSLLFFNMLTNFLIEFLFYF